MVRACVQPGRARRRLKIHAACVTARVLADALRAHGSVDGVPVEGGLSEGETTTVVRKVRSKDTRIHAHSQTVSLALAVFRGYDFAFVVDLRLRRSPSPPTRRTRTR